MSNLSNIIRAVVIVLLALLAPAQAQKAIILPHPEAYPSGIPGVPMLEGLPGIPPQWKEEDPSYMRRLMNKEALANLDSILVKEVEYWDRMGWQLKDNIFQDLRAASTSMREDWYKNWAIKRYLRLRQLVVNLKEGTTLRRRLTEEDKEDFLDVRMRVVLRLARKDLTTAYSALEKAYPGQPSPSEP